MSFLYVWHSVPVNKSKRPFLTENEHHVFVKDGVGIYQGKLKIRHFQNGRVYLTNKRIIFLDLGDVPKGLAIDLADVTKAEYVDKFLRSSPKVKVYLREKSGVVDNEFVSDNKSLLESNKIHIVDWVCGICSFNNHISLDIDLLGALPKCVSCGIPPTREQLEEVLKHATQAKPDSSSSQETDSSPDQCPKCTFINHPSMRFCEVCGAALKQASSSVLKKITDYEQKRSLAVSNPLGLVLEEPEVYTNNTPYVKLSFRKGGDSEFYKNLQDIMDLMKWQVLEATGGVGSNATKLVSKPEPVSHVQSRGIQGLVKTEELQRKKNERVLSLSLEDLEQLMQKAQEILELTSSFSSLVKKPQIPPLTIPPLLVTLDLSIYLPELAQHMSEYLLNVVLTKKTSMITTQDLFASYNRYSVYSQGFGGELVTTQNFQKCLQYFDTLKLPVRLETYQSGLVVITQRLHDLQDIHQVILEYLAAEENQFLYEKFTSELLADADGYMKDTYRFFKGRTVTEIADHFNWSSAVCLEELTRCIEYGLVVWDKHILGTFYYLNKFDPALSQKIEQDAVLKEKAQRDVLNQQTLISSELRLQQEMSQSLLHVNDFDFGAQSDVQSETKTSESLLANEPVSESLSLLSGLKF